MGAKGLRTSQGKIWGHKTMKTIGTCKECEWWVSPEEAYPCRVGSCVKMKELDDDESTKFCVPRSGGQLDTGEDFGCVHWMGDEIPETPNYPTRTAQDLEIADLKRENNAAFERIQELSAELVRLGYDPTARREGQ